jgi:hypothetical protein
MREALGEIFNSRSAGTFLMCLTSMVTTVTGTVVMSGLAASTIPTISFQRLNVVPAEVAY